MRSALALLALGLLLTGCGGAEEAGDGSLRSVEGDWELVGGVATVEGFPITLSIEGNEASGRAACNSYFGTVDYDATDIAFGELGWTEMGCQQPVMESERAYLDALVGVSAYSFDQESLVLTGANGTLSFLPVTPAPTEALVDTVWTLETIIEGEAAMSVAGDPATLLLGADGTITATTGCRELTGRWRESGGVIAVPELSAEGECSDELWKQDSLIVTVIGDEFSAAVEGNTLTLTSMGGDGLVYRAAD